MFVRHPIAMRGHLLPIALLCALPDLCAQNNFVLSFDGTSDQVNLGAAGTGVRSIEFWFRPSAIVAPNTSADGYSFVLRNDGFQTNEFGCYIRGTDWPTGRGSLYFFTRDNGALHEIVSDNNVWNAGQWYHVVGVIDPLLGMRMFIDGALQSSTDPFGTVAIPAAPEDTYLGSWGDAFIRHWNGRLDEVRFWDRALDQSEIVAKMCHWLSPPDETGLVGYWRMDEGAGVVLGDQGTDANNGDINGALYVADEVCFDGVLEVPEANSGRTELLAVPNPANDAVTLTTPTALTNATLIIIDAAGQVVRELGGINGTTLRVQREGSPSGLYHFRIMDGTQVLQQAIVVWE